MNLPSEKLLKGCSDEEGMRHFVLQAENVLRSWQPTWSQFIGAPLKEEVFTRLTSLSDLQWFGDGGYPGAERQRILCSRNMEQDRELKRQAPIRGMLIQGNFLFDTPTPKDIRQALEALGAPSNGLGDIWIQGDRGAQALCTPETTNQLNGLRGNVRDVAIRCEEIEMERLQLPPKRVSKIFSSVEASCRLDAIASAGFGISRTKVVDHIRKEKLRLNWKPIKHAHKDISIGDRLQLESKGCIEVLSLNLTKRQRWRVEMKRH